jgi:hypothetical protein
MPAKTDTEGGKITQPQELEINNEIAKLLRSTMEEFDVENVQLADAAGILLTSVSRIRNLDRNGVSPSAVNLVRVVRGLTAIARVQFVCRLFKIGSRDLQDYLEYDLDKQRRMLR